jgi:drug/metabolite transporter (DMT)-like permease
MKHLASQIERPDAPIKGIIFVIVGVSVFSLHDVAIKWMSPDYAVHEIIFVRSLVAIVPILFIIRFEGGLFSLRTRRPLMHLLRSCAMLMAFTCYNLALAALPLAETLALFFSAPLFVTALAVPLLGEKVELSRWLAVFIGFLGVMIILRPGAAMVDLTALLPVMAAFLYAIVVMVTRRLGVTDSGSSMAFYSTVLYLIAAAMVGLAVGKGTFAVSEHASVQFLLRAWVFPVWPDIALMMLCGLLAAFGFYFLSQAYRVAEASAVVPFEYIGLPLAVMWGYIFWDDLPDGYTIMGSALVVGAGLYVLHRQASSLRE